MEEIHQADTQARSPEKLFLQQKADASTQAKSQFQLSQAKLRFPQEEPSPIKRNQYLILSQFARRLSQVYEELSPCSEDQNQQVPQGQPVKMQDDLAEKLEKAFDSRISDQEDQLEQIAQLNAGLAEALSVAVLKSDKSRRLQLAKEIIRQPRTIKLNPPNTEERFNKKKYKLLCSAYDPYLTSLNTRAGKEKISEFVDRMRACDEQRAKRVQQKQLQIRTQEDEQLKVKIKISRGSRKLLGKVGNQPIYNRVQKIIKKKTEWKEAELKKVEQERAKLQQEQQRQLQKARQSKRNLNPEFYSDKQNWHIKLQQQLKLLKKKAEEEELQTCTFRPSLTKQSKKILKKLQKKDKKEKKEKTDQREPTPLLAQFIGGLERTQSVLDKAAPESILMEW